MAHGDHQPKLDQKLNLRWDQPHNLKVVGSNPTAIRQSMGLFLFSATSRKLSMGESETTTPVVDGHLNHGATRWDLHVEGMRPPRQ